MKKTVLLFCLIGVFFSGIGQAQVVDVRAFSRQRGFKAYQARPSPAPVVRRPVAVADEPMPSEKTCSDGSCMKIDPAEPKKINQTGVKVFQEKDEDKVMNFDVENPEFDKLNDRKKEDVMKRIIFEK